MYKAAKWIPWKEYSEKEKDSLIEILKRANTEKDILINKQAGELVFLNHQIAEHDKIFNDMTKIIGNLENEQTA
jgi:hypothetical protein